MADYWLRESPASQALPLCMVFRMVACWLRKFPASPPALYMTWKIASTTKQPQKAVPQHSRSGRANSPPQRIWRVLQGEWPTGKPPTMSAKNIPCDGKTAYAHKIERRTRQQETGTSATLRNTCVSGGLIATGKPSAPAPSMPTNEQTKKLPNTETRAPAYRSQRHGGI